jgi:hypothetical protein
MPLRQFLTDPDITAEIARAMARAYEDACTTLRARGVDIAPEDIARYVAEEASKGAQDADLLTQRVLKRVEATGDRVHA